VGRGDEAIPTTEYGPITTGLTGKSPSPVASKEIGGDAGRYEVVRDRRSNAVTDRSILFDKDLSRESGERVVAHEIGHAIDEFAGSIPVRKHKPKLAEIYNELNNPDLAQARARNPNVDLDSNTKFRGWTPKKNGYEGAEAERELMAEAIRAYLADPNYIKTVAPDLAKFLRKSVNTNPRLKDIVQLNSVGALTAAGADGALAYPAMRADEE
jgi:hypothetical protein